MRSFHFDFPVHAGLPNGTKQLFFFRDGLVWSVRPILVGKDVSWKAEILDLVKKVKEPVPPRLFFAAPQRIAITLIPIYYQKKQRFTTRKNEEEHGPDVM